MEQLRGDVASGLFALGEANGTAAGTLKYQLHDSLFWPDVPDGESAFVHRVAVRRDYAGGVVSGALLKWAVDRTRAMGLPYLRLDCDASRSKLRSVYERFGFRYHSDNRVGPYHVSRLRVRGNRKRMPQMKKMTPAASPDAYVEALDGWRRKIVTALRSVVRAAPALDEVVKWGHLVYLANGPVLLIRAEESRVLFGFWRGQRLTRHRTSPQTRWQV